LIGMEYLGVTQTGVAVLNKNSGTIPIPKVSLSDTPKLTWLNRIHTFW